MMEEKFNFEKSMTRLEEITNILEKGEISLDDMIGLYSEGTKIISSCSKALDEAQIKISKLNLESDIENE